MVRFLIRRVLLGVFVMFVVTIVVFLIFFVGPGSADVARTLAGREATPKTVALVAHRLLLDRPLTVQYWHFLDGLLHGNLGYSYYHGQPVTTILKQAFPVTLSLALGAAAIWLVVGVLSGVLSAVRSRSIWDRVVTVLALFFYSMPSFVLGLLLLYIFYYQFALHGIHLFPGAGYTYLTARPAEMVPGPGAALDHPGPGVGCGLHPAHPRFDARCDERGLCPHRPLQGAVGDTGSSTAMRSVPRSPRSSASSASTSGCWPAGRSSPRRCSGCPASGSPRSRPSRTRICR